jgi:hypothetical protein
MLQSCQGNVEVFRVGTVILHLKMCQTTKSNKEEHESKEANVRSQVTILRINCMHETEVITI